MNPIEAICLTHPGSCNGVCEKDTGRCVCPPGGYWSDDTGFFRYQNCAVPYWYNTTAASLFLISSLCIQLYIMMYYRNKRGYAQHIIRYASLTNISIMIASISHFAYDGTNPIFWLCQAFSTVGASSGFTTYMIAFFVVNYKTAKKPVPERTLKLISFVSIASVSAPCFCFAFFGSIYYGLPNLPSFNPSAYNDFIAISVGAMPIQLLLTGPLFLKVSNELIDSLKLSIEIKKEQAATVSTHQFSPASSTASSNNKVGDVTVEKLNNNAGKSGDSIDSIVSRLKFLRFMMIFVTIPGEVSFCVGVALLHFLLRFKYIFILYFLLVLTLECVVIVLVVVSGKSDKKSSHDGALSPVQTESKSSTNKPLAVHAGSKEDVASVISDIKKQ